MVIILVYRFYDEDIIVVIIDDLGDSNWVTNSTQTVGLHDDDNIYVLTKYQSICFKSRPRPTR